MSRLLLISPVRNEGGNLERLAHSVEQQTRRPDLWLIVDDGSTDGTLATARRIASELGFVRVLPHPRGGATDHADRLADAAELRAFNAGLRSAAWRSYEHVAKVDGDVELPPEFFERLLAEFARRPRLGIAGGDLVEPGRNARWDLLKVPSHHVHGGLRIWSRDCLEAIGDFAPVLGWDTVDLTYARMRGYETRSFGDLVARHHRPWGAAGGRLRGAARYGRCAYAVRYGFGWVALRSFKVALTRPFGLMGVAFLYGYVRSVLRSEPRVEDPAFRHFVRGELRARLSGILRPSRTGHCPEEPALRGR